MPPTPTRCARTYSTVPGRLPSATVPATTAQRCARHSLCSTPPATRSAARSCVSAAAADRSLKALFATGLFSDVTIDMQGSTLVVKVTENPILNRVVFEGNKKIEDDKLKDEVQSKPRQVFTRGRVQSDVERILTIYRRSGRYNGDCGGVAQEAPAAGSGTVCFVLLGPQGRLITHAHSPVEKIPRFSGDARLLKVSIEQDFCI